MDPLYDVCFAGEILQGRELDGVKLRISKLFNADEATLDRLFSGKTQLLKRACDRQTALKYKKAIEQAGAKPVIRQSEQSTPAKTPAKPDEPATPKLSAAERIAQLAAAPDIGSPVAAAPNPADDAPAKVENSEDPGSMELAPTGADVLRPEERHTQPEINIETSNIELMSAGVDLADSQQDSATAPDVSHLSMGEVGEDIPTLTNHREPLSPDISAIALSPQDSDYLDCTPETVAEPALDLSGIVLAPTGSDMLESDGRKDEGIAPPKTDHLSLEDS